jgi:preprotein translocase subunit SecE
MSKTEEGGLWRTVLSAGLYKRNQGRLVRGLTSAALALTAALGAYTLYETLSIQFDKNIGYAVGGAIAVIFGWLAFRIVHWPVFAEFLISVEDEMQKVSWPSKLEQHRAVVVVLVTMLIMVVFMAVFDSFWWVILKTIGVLRA